MTTEMGRSPCSWPHVTLGLLVLIHCFAGAVALAAADEKFHPSPINITFHMKTMFTLLWKWSPSDIIQNTSCDPVKYYSEVYTRESSKEKKLISSKYLYREMGVEMFGKTELNNAIFLNVRSESKCLINNVTLFIKSQWTNTSVLLISGPIRLVGTTDTLNQDAQSVTEDPETLEGVPDQTAVTGFTCIWYNKEHMVCTWHPGDHSPPNTNYTLLYWLKGESSGFEGTFPKPTQFEQLLTSGKPCLEYMYKDAVPLGCRFTGQQAPKDNSEFQMVITGESKHIRPFISYVNVNRILKLSPPQILNVSRFLSQNIYVSWNASEAVKIHCLKFEIEVNESTWKEPPRLQTESGNLSKNITGFLPQAEYAIRVRVSQTKFCESENIWSEWSEARSVPAEVEEVDGTVYITLLLLIPIIIAAATIILLIYLKRLKILVFPPIPDPGKIFKNRFGDPNDFQQFIKYGKVNVSSKPPKEEICTVILVESPI